MKKIAAVLGLLMLLCSITACDSSMGVSGTQNYFLPNETNDISVVDGTGDSPNSNGMEEVDNMQTNDDNDGKEDSEESTEGMLSPIGIVAELKQNQYSFSEESISVQLYCGVDRSFHNLWTESLGENEFIFAELWFISHSATYEALKTEIETISPEEIALGKYCFDPVGKDGLMIYPPAKTVEIPMSLLTEENGSLTFYYFPKRKKVTNEGEEIIYSIYGEDCPHAWNLVDLRYRRTADGIEFYDIDYPYGCAYMGRA